MSAGAFLPRALLTSFVLTAGLLPAEPPPEPAYEPSLDELRLEMQKPLPPLEEPPDRYAKALATPPNLNKPAPEPSWGIPLSVAIVGAISLLITYRSSHGRPFRPISLKAAIARIPPIPIAAGQRILAKRTQFRPADPPPPVPVKAPPVEALTSPQIQDYRNRTVFSSWPEFLTAARCGNKLARTILDSSPRHPSLDFSLDSPSFKEHLHLARNLAFSAEWVSQILLLLRMTEVLHQSITIVSPLGQKHDIPLTASISTLNAVLGYENLSHDVRQQLELRRWVLWNTRADGTEQPDVLLTFRQKVAAA